MTEYGLGPNGAMLYCMEYLEANFDWLEEGLAELEGGYVIFDVAGQVSHDIWIVNLGAVRLRERAAGCTEEAREEGEAC